MPETIPRRRAPNVWLQITVAVLSGAAAMYCLENIRGAPPPPPRPARASESGPAARAARVKEKAVAIPARVKGSKTLPEKSMLVKPEPGGAPEGMVRAYYDDAEGSRARSHQFGNREPDKTQVRLQSRPSTIGRGFQPVEFRPMTFKRKAPPPDAKAPVAVKFYPKLLSQEPLADKDLPPPSPLHPEDIPEKPFWTQEKLFKVWTSGLFALIGFGFCLKASGLLDPRSRESEGKV